jgi:hypothetical protein
MVVGALGDMKQLAKNLFSDKAYVLVDIGSMGG